MTDRTSDGLTAREAVHREVKWGLLCGGFDDANEEADRLVKAFIGEIKAEGNPLADRTRSHWRVEARETDGEWVWVSSAPDSPEEAQAKRDGVLRRHPGAETRIVRVTETHTIEPDVF